MDLAGIVFFFGRKKNKQKTRQTLNLKQLPDFFFLNKGFPYNFGEIYGKKHQQQGGKWDQTHLSVSN